MFPNSEKKQNTQTIHDDDEEVSEIPKSMALGSGLKPGSRRASQALEKTAERANKGNLLSLDKINFIFSIFVFFLYETLADLNY